MSFGWQGSGAGLAFGASLVTDDDLPSGYEQAVSND